MKCWRRYCVMLLDEQSCKVVRSLATISYCTTEASDFSEISYSEARVVERCVWVLKVADLEQSTYSTLKHRGVKHIRTSVFAPEILTALTAALLSYYLNSHFDPTAFRFAQRSVNQLHHFIDRRKPSISLPKNSLRWWSPAKPLQINRFSLCMLKFLVLARLRKGPVWPQMPILVPSVLYVLSKVVYLSAKCRL